MSRIDLRVELPAYSLSFHVQVSELSSIQDVKEEISKSCPGAPRADGQRVIWRGRFLNNEEKVADIWKSADDSRIVHLSVHPSAWTASPPSLPELPSTPSSSQSQSPAPHVSRGRATQTPPISNPYPMYTSAGAPLPYIIHKHQAAMHVLTHGKLPDVSDSSILANLRPFTLVVVQSQGWSWPSVFDEDYPPCDDSVEGLKYVQVMIGNQPFLKLTSPNAAPSECQLHAFKVLSYTFPLLSISTPVDQFPYPHAPSYNMPYPTPNTNLNNHLQQLGLPPLRLVPNQNANQNPNDPNNPLGPEIRAIPLRALMMPLMMLTFRTLILMYFFSPSKRPLFGLLLSAWIIYEAWGAFRAVLGNDQPGVDGPGRVGVAAGPNAQRGAVPGAPAIPGAGSNQGTGRTQMDAIFDRLAGVSLASEERTLAADTRHPPVEPTVAQRVKMFFGLMIMTLHPAVWDRRRGSLRRREGRLRAEANIRESQNIDENDTSDESANRARLRVSLVARHERRQGWVKRYIERVQNTEWADDA